VIPPLEVFTPLYVAMEYLLFLLIHLPFIIDIHIELHFTFLAVVSPAVILRRVLRIGDGI